MNFEQLIEEWRQDSNIDITALDEESLKSPKLHHKYYTEYVKERAVLRKLQSDLKRLELEKFEFYTQGPSDEQKNKGWKLPPKGQILKAEVQRYLDADKDLIDLSLKIGMQQEKCDYLISIIKSISGRSFDIKNSIEFRKYIMGS